MLQFCSATVLQALLENKMMRSQFQYNAITFYILHHINYFSSQIDLKIFNSLNINFTAFLYIFTTLSKNSISCKNKWHESLITREGGSRYHQFDHKRNTYYCVCPPYAYNLPLAKCSCFYDEIKIAPIYGDVNDRAANTRLQRCLLFNNQSVTAEMSTD